MKPEDIKYLRPELDGESEHNIWLDPYIQNQMLKEHLNPGSDGASRRMHSITRTVDFIDSHLGKPSAILDLGCGPGLYAEPLSGKGHRVTGIDFNRASVDYARSRNGNIEYLCGDYIRDYPQGHFDAVLLIYCDFGTHSAAARQLLLHNVYGSLNKSGIFIFDFFPASAMSRKDEAHTWQCSPEAGFWSPGGHLLLEQSFIYPDQNVCCRQYNLMENRGIKHFIVWEKYFEEKEVVELLVNTGFSDVSFHTSVTGNNNFTDSGEVFVVARK